MMKKQRPLGPWAVLMCLTAIFLAGCNIFTGPDKDRVATPSFDPPGGAYAAGQTVTISCSTPGATIYYSTDGSDPTLLYTASVHISATCTLKAVATRLEWKDSAVANATYTITVPSDWAFVQGGTFNNGTSDVTVSSFYIDKYELSQADYQSVMGVNPSYFAGVTNGPVEQVSWFNAIEYCNRRSLQEGLTPCYSYSSYGSNPDNWPSGWNLDNDNHTNISCNWTANGYRLPTEMEWMFAARGGNQTHNYTYSGSNDLKTVGWYSSNSDGTTHPVGTKAANELGSFDMSGNVREWCWDIYSSYLGGAQTDPHGAISGHSRVWRGGSWGGIADYCSLSFRSDGNPLSYNDEMGFRVCRIAP